jgi:hypothetical protein
MEMEVWKALHEGEDLSDDMKVSIAESDNVLFFLVSGVRGLR